MRSLFLGILVFLAGMSYGQTELHWETNFEIAQTRAKTGNKLILMSFQGSDWCANCKRLEKTLFESEDFKALVKEKFVLLKLDFPAKKQNKLSAEQTKYNDEMASKYNQNGAFPKVLIFNFDGTLKGEMNKTSPQLEAYIKSLKSFATN